MNKISNYFQKNNIFANIILTILATFFTEFLGSFLNDIVSPLIDFNKDGIEDSKNLSSYEIIINGRNIKVGLFLLSLIKLFIIISLIVLIIYFIK
jgi:large-conductance mechanosensitive channel